MSEIGHIFSRPALLLSALIHPSALGGGAEESSYERMEFLGDRVLSLVVAEMLLERFPKEAEGEIARRHAQLVKRDTLARIAREIDLGRQIVMAKGEEDAGGRENPSLLADACESLIGALYLDGGLATAAQFVRARWNAPLAEAKAPPKDAKTALQEWAQGRGLALPFYRTLSVSGPSHAPDFMVEVSVDGFPSENSRGGSKRAAEQTAAELLLTRLKNTDKA